MEKDFEKIYNKIINQDTTELIRLNKIIYIPTILLLINTGCIFICMIIATFIRFFLKLLFPLSIPLLILSIINIICRKKYIETYQSLCEKYIVKPLVQYINPNYKISEIKKITKEIYDDAEFEQYVKIIKWNSLNKYLYLKSYTGIYDDDTQISEIEIDGSGETNNHYIFCSTKIENNYENPIRIRSTKNHSQTYAHKKEQIELNCPLLKDIFNVFTKDIKNANKLLNESNSKKIIEIYNKINRYFEITIKDNKLYIRILCNNTFDFSFIRKNPFDKKELEDLYNLLYLTNELINLFKEIIKDAS